MLPLKISHEEIFNVTGIILSLYVAVLFGLFLRYKIKVRKMNMPALDSLIGGGAIHISDQNKLNPVKTLCGQALDKESIRYFASRDNFVQATCKVCRGTYFEEAWTGEPRPEARPEPAAQEPVTTLPQTPPSATGGDEPQTREPATRTTLFGGLTKPVNSHSADIAAGLGRDIGNGS